MTRAGRKSSLLSTRMLIHRGRCCAAVGFVLACCFGQQCPAANLDFPAGHTFQWNSGENVAQHRLWVGTTVGQKDIYNPSIAQIQPATVSGLPIDGSPVCDRLNSYISGGWFYNDYIFQTVTVSDIDGTPADMLVPADNNAVLPGRSFTFEWDTDVNVTRCCLWAGTTAGGSNLYSQFTSSALSAAVTDLPLNGSTLHVRLNFCVADGDTVADCRDNNQTLSNPNQADRDNDGHGDSYDNCPLAFNPERLNSNGNDIGDECERPSSGWDSGLATRTPHLLFPGLADHAAGRQTGKSSVWCVE